jgi:hypothetical protein
MSTATLDIDSTVDADDTLQYRALHTGAVIGFVLAGFSSVFTIIASASSPEACIGVALLNVPALSLCMWSLARIRREPDLYTGRMLATTGLALSLVFLVGGVTFGTYVYATEVPEGYARISFNAMKPDALQERSNVIVPPEIAALNGQKVFIKGYIRPDSIKVSRGIKQFLLVRDNNQCCFGDITTVKYYDQILVDMAGSRYVDYSDGIFRMGGILKVEPQYAAIGSRAPVFSLKADYAN